MRHPCRLNVHLYLYANDRSDKETDNEDDDYGIYTKFYHLFHILFPVHDKLLRQRKDAPHKHKVTSQGMKIGGEEHFTILFYGLFFYIRNFLWSYCNLGEV